MKVICKSSSGPGIRSSRKTTIVKPTITTTRRKTIRSFCAATTGFRRDGQQLDYCKALTSYFCLPEQGMTEYEMLSRASLILVKPFSPNFPKSYHILAPAHVTHPWLFKKFYPESSHGWLQFVHEEATINKIGLRDTTGEMLAEFELERTNIRHDKFDLVALYIRDEDEFGDDVMMKRRMQVLELAPIPPNPGEELIAVGHDLDVKPGTEEEVMIPTWCDAKVTTRRPQDNRGFASTLKPAPMGMCGGPMLNKKNQVAGIIEGLVNAIPKHRLKDVDTNPTLQEWKKVEQNIVYIETPTVITWLKDIEANFAQHQQDALKKGGQNKSRVLDL